MGGSKGQPKLIRIIKKPFPLDYSRVQIIDWFLQELDDFIQANDGINEIIIKSPDAMSRRNTAYEERLENQGVAYLAASRNGIRLVTRKVRSTIAKDLGLKGNSREYAAVDCSQIYTKQSSISEDERDSILAAWSGLR